MADNTIGVTPGPVSNGAVSVSNSKGLLSWTSGPIQGVARAADVTVGSWVALFAGIRLPMGAKCVQAIHCGLWVQHLSLGSGPFEHSCGVGSCKAQLSLLHGWQVCDEPLTA